MTPLVSVIMPVYNQERYLAETIESVLGQSFHNFEFLILDDGSTDNSAEIIREYTTKDKRIIPFFESNAGKCVATNKIAKKAKGKLYAFLDADDLMLSDRLEKQVLFHLENPEVDGTSCHCYYINEKGNFLGKQRYPFLKTIEECRNVLKENRIIHCAFTGLMITKRTFEYVGGLRSEFWPCEDLEFANRLIEKGFVLVIIQEVLMKYRIHSSSITAQKQWHMFEVSDYTRNCITRRRAGMTELSFEEFLLKKREESWRIKFYKKRHRYSQILHKNAGFAFYSNQYLSFCWQFLTASLLDPGYVAATLRNRLRLSNLL